MFSEHLLARLSELNQQRMPLIVDAAGSTADAPLAPNLTAACPLREPDEDVSKLPHGEECMNAWGTHWLRQRPLTEIWPHGDHWLSHQLVRWDEIRCSLATRSRELRAMCEALPGGVVYLDLETCGFSGSMIFLVGLIYQHNDAFLLTQLFARSYAEEKAVLQTLWQIVADKRVLVTFNGKSFDWPMVHDRSTLHHLGYEVNREVLDTTAPLETAPCDRTRLGRSDPRPQLRHCDLLHHARRRWKDQLPNCKLQTLEKIVCRRRREDDIPGREIPTAYHDFVRSGDAWLIRSVLHHNALDLITLLQVSMAILH